MTSAEKKTIINFKKYSSFEFHFEIFRYFFPLLSVFFFSLTLFHRFVYPNIFYSLSFNSGLEIIHERFFSFLMWTIKLIKMKWSSAEKWKILFSVFLGVKQSSLNQFISILFKSSNFPNLVICASVSH